jgi:hypothetical protein
LPIRSVEDQVEFDAGVCGCERQLALMLGVAMVFPGGDFVNSRPFVRIPTQSGHRFRFEAGHRSDLMPATIPK